MELLKFLIYSFLFVMLISSCEKESEEILIDPTELSEQGSATIFLIDQDDNPVPNFPFLVDIPTMGGYPMFRLEDSTDEFGKYQLNDLDKSVYCLSTKYKVDNKDHHSRQYFQISAGQNETVILSLDD